MPIVQFKDCSVEGDLAQALLDMQQQIGDTTTAILSEISALAVDLTIIPQGHDIMDKMVLLSPNPLPRSTVATNTGIPQSDPTITDDEERLEQLGLILVKGILYLSNSSGNIEAYRRLYFSLGSNLGLFLTTVQSNDAFAVIQTHIQIKHLPTKPTWTLTEAQTLYNNPAIEAVYQAGDGENYVIVPEFLALNQAKDQVSRVQQIPQEEILTQVFWLNQVNQTPQTVAQLIRLGEGGNELTASLFGTRLLTLIPTAAQASNTAAGIATGKAISQLTLLNQRFTKLDLQSRVSLQQDAKLSISEARVQWLIQEQKVRAWSTVLIRPADISDFLTKNTQVDLQYLFTSRRTVTGINFQATNDEVMARLRQVDHISSGSSAVSSLAVNSTSITIDPQIDQANKTLVQNFCSLQQMSGILAVKIDQVQTALACLNQSLVTPTVTTATTSTMVVPVIGYASSDSPSSIIARQMNFNITFNTDGILKKLSDAADKLTAPLKFLIRTLVAAMLAAKIAIDMVFVAMNAKISKLTAQIEGFLSRFAAFHETASLDSSVLKCALGLDIQLSIPLLDSLAAFLAALKSKLHNILASFLKIVTDMLKKLLCIPVNFLNSFITSVEDSLPAFCHLNKISLPSDIESLIIQLQNIFKMQSDNFSAFSRDLLKLSAGIKAAPLKLDQFRGSILCDSPASSNLFKALQFTKGIGGSAVAAATGALSSTSTLPLR